MERFSQTKKQEVYTHTATLKINHRFLRIFLCLFQSVNRERYLLADTYAISSFYMVNPLIVIHTFQKKLDLIYFVRESISFLCFPSLQCLYPTSSL